MSAAFWDNMANGYSQQPIGDPEAYEYTTERTRSYLSATDKVLEIGCGTGGTARLLAPSVAEIIGTDISSGMIAIANRRAAEEGVENVRFETADALDPSFGDGQFDAILAHNLLHLLEDIPATVQRAHALLKPGGYFISKSGCLKEPNLGFKMGLMKLVLPLVQKLGKAPYVNYISIAELEGMITAPGFRIVESGNHPARPPSRYVVAVKL